MNKTEHKILFKLIDKYYQKKKVFYPLSKDPFSKEDLVAGINTLLKGRVTMSELTMKFELEFAKFFNSKYSLMVNSGSSANLLAFQTLINPKNKKALSARDECIIPSLCWSTSLWPIVQSGLKPIFVDINIKTYNIDIEKLEKKITSKTKAILAVHILGNCTNMIKLKKIAEKYKLILIEDTCEALGSKYNNKYLGTFGRFGTFSFFVSHQLTAGEGGMLLCKNIEDYKIANTLRAHGWTRDLNKKNIKDFNFINSGFNLRPLDLTAAIGYNQFKRLNKLNEIRTYNRNKIIKEIKNSKKWNYQFEFLEPEKHLKPSWFGLPILIKKNYVKNKNKYLKYLNNHGLETRPIISGNFLNQPSINLYNLNPKNEKFPNAQIVEDRGFFIGLHANKINDIQLKKLINLLLSIN